MSRQRGERRKRKRSQLFREEDQVSKRSDLGKPQWRKPATKNFKKKVNNKKM